MTTQLAVGTESERLHRVYVHHPSRVLHSRQLCLAPPIPHTWTGVIILAGVIKPAIMRR